MNLYDAVTASIADPQTSALIAEDVLEPTRGRTAAICPPTYSGGEKGKPHYALSNDGPIPTQSESGWYHEPAKTDDGKSRTGQRVVVNALAACADQAETALFRNQDRLGITLPGFVLDARSVGDTTISEALKAATPKDSELPVGIASEVRKALNFQASSWELAHRTADSWLMYAQVPDGAGQVWSSDNDVKQILLDICRDSGDRVYSYAPNTAIYGVWLSSGTAHRNKIPRAYSCEIVGFGASLVSRGAVKLDMTGGASKDSRVNVVRGELLNDAKTGKKPSDFGFGQVPNDPATRAVSCELILRQASISLRALGAFHYQADTARNTALAATRVYVLLAVTGHLLAQEDGFLRSECDLVSVEQRWGWRRHGERTPIPLDTPTIDEARDALTRAIGEAERAGLAFAPPVSLTPSDAQVQLIVERVVAEVTKGAKESE